MASRAVGGAAALGVAAGLVAMTVVMVGGGANEPAPLPVGGAGRDPAAGTVDGSTAPGAGPVVYRAGGSLAELDGEARAWSLGSAEGGERTAALAGAVGVAGEVVETEEGWEVTDQAGRVEVARRPGLPWSYAATGVPATEEVAPSGSSEDVAPSGSSDEVVSCDMPACPAGTACAQVCPPDDGAGRERPAALPSAAEAEALARSVLESAGVDVDRAAVRVDGPGDSWEVTVDPRIDDLPTVGMASVVSVGGGGVIGFASGWLAEPRPGDRYPLVGTSEALRRLQADRASVCPERSSCEPVVVTVTGVQVGLQLVPAPAGEPAWLVPSYLFETDGGAGPDLVTFAVVEEHLAAPPPVPEPPDPDLALHPPPGPSSAGEACTGGSGASSGGADADTPPTLEVCGPAAVTVGEVARFQLEAFDPDSTVRDDCGSPLVSFGDEAGGPAVCEIACVAAGPGPGEVHRRFEHVYQEPGSYQATFALVACDPSGAVEATVRLPVTVSGR